MPYRTRASSTCTIQWPDGAFCDRPAILALDYPVCATHAIHIYRELAALIESNEDNDIIRTMMLLDHLDGREVKRKAATSLRSASPVGGDSVVYYLLVDGLVKIGKTKDLGQRLSAYPPSSQLLATEPGGNTVEKMRHEEFAEYLAHGREWFTPGPALRAHVESLDTYCTT